MSLPIICVDIDEYLNDLFYERYELINNEHTINTSNQLFNSYNQSIDYINSHKQYKNELLFDLMTEIYSVKDDNLLTDSQFTTLFSNMRQ